ncbi:MAG: hypothetical protein M1834_000546 [Cirrosporium novae-zelandiae]|nr:MAG: hypothetical protein M1834_000546 [Cirrosporium novae-zelandiae]
MQANRALQYGLRRTALMQGARSSTFLLQTASSIGAIAPLVQRMQLPSQRLFSMTKSILQNTDLDPEIKATQEFNPDVRDQIRASAQPQPRKKAATAVWRPLMNAPFLPSKHSFQPLKSSLLFKDPPAAPEPTWGPYLETETEARKVPVPQKHLDTAEFSSSVRNLMRRVPQNVAVILSKDLPLEKDGKARDRKFGLTVSSFNTVSLDPIPIVSFNIKLPSRTWTAIDRSHAFTVHLLNDSRVATSIARKFAGPDLAHKGVQPSDIEEMTYKVSGRSPLLKVMDAVSFAFQCELLSTHSVGDHMVVFGKVEKVYCPEGAESLKYSDKSTLCYGNRSFRSAIMRVMEPPGRYPTKYAQYFPDIKEDKWHFVIDDSPVVNVADSDAPLLDLLNQTPPPIPSPEEIHPYRLPFVYLQRQLISVDKFIEKVEGQMEELGIPIPTTQLTKSKGSRIPSLNIIENDIGRTGRIIDRIQAEFDHLATYPEELSNINLDAIDKELIQTGKEIAEIESTINALDSDDSPEYPNKETMQSLESKSSLEASRSLESIEEEIDQITTEISDLDREISRLTQGHTSELELAGATPTLDEIERQLIISGKRINLIQAELDVLEANEVDHVDEYQPHGAIPWGTK